MSLSALRSERNDSRCLHHFYPERVPFVTLHTGWFCREENGPAEIASPTPTSNGRVNQPMYFPTYQHCELRQRTPLRCSKDASQSLTLSNIASTKNPVVSQFKIYGSRYLTSSYTHPKISTTLPEAKATSLFRSVPSSPNRAQTREPGTRR